MENCTVNLGDEIREESSARGPKLRTKRRRFMKCKHWKNGSLPRLAPSTDEDRRQESNTKPPCYTVFKCLIPYLLAVVGVKYQAISQDPTMTLPLNTWSFLISIFIYSLILFAMKQSRNHGNMNLQIILGRVSLASGVVSYLSLMSLLLPRFPGLIVLYISWVFFVIISALPILQFTYNGLLRAIITVLNVLICFGRNLLSKINFGLQQPPPQGTRPPV